MRHKVSELEGELLDSAVASALGYRLHVRSGNDRVIWAYNAERFVGYITGANFPQFRPSSCWQDGGPIIERERIETMWDPKRCWEAHVAGTSFRKGWADGQTLLIAAMRAYVADQLGDEVELP